MLKTTTIIALIISAIYLAGQLWFVEVSKRSFSYVFSSIFSSDAPINVDESLKPFATPYRIITNFGNKTYSIAYSNIQNTEAKKYGDEAITQILSGGEFVGVSDINWDKMLGCCSYIYEYNFQLPTDIFVHSFNRRSSNINSKVKAFNSIVIIPEQNDKIRILFVDEKSNQYFEYISKQTPQAPIAEQLRSSIEQQNTGEKLLYISSKQLEKSNEEESSVFLKNVFIPSPTNNYKYSLISKQNPYSPSGELLLKTVEKNIDLFFDKPASKWWGAINNVYTYSNENVVVKYYPNDVLEYSDYSISTRDTNSTLETDYYIAVNFLLMDTTITNEYYLADYSINEGKTTFYFDYVINDYPLKLSSNIISKIELQHFIEITVEHRKVRKYKKLVYNYVINENKVKEAAKIDFESLINLLLPTEASKEASLETALNSVVLGYNVDESKQLLLYWFLNVDGKTYAQSTKK